MPDSRSTATPMHTESWPARRPRTRLALAPLLGGAVLLWAGSAVAQQKIAPTRTYGTGPDGANYLTTLKEHPDKNFGLPTFGQRGAEMPKQLPLGGSATGQQTATRNATPDAAAPTPDLGMPAPGDGPGGAPGAAGGGMPGAGAAGGASAPMDFFPSTTEEFQLPKQKQAAAAGMDTPLYTTQDGMETTTDGTTTDGMMSRDTDGATQIGTDGADNASGAAGD
ncbi:MAG TPA: hypothetical protein VHO91_02150 [Rhodopila sp.]|nr:hypothetical protein [Rhodopila sp.]